MRRFTRLLLAPLARINPAEATVLSFIAMSLIGGIALFYTESGRVVTAKVPVHQEVEVSVVGDVPPGVDAAPVKELHAFAKSVTYRGETFIDMLFTSVSALCVTGLTSTDFSEFTFAGQVITLVLIQMGGLGIIVFTSLFAFLIAKGLSERQTFGSLLAGILDTSLSDVGRMLKHVAIYTIFFEGIAFLIMGIHLRADPSQIGDINPWWWALFHSVSAFNNAGFGLLNNNLMNFPKDPIINMVIAGLIITGGLGYPVLIALHTWLRGKVAGKNDRVYQALKEDVGGVVASPVQTRVAISGTLFFLLLGTAIPLVMEWTSPLLRDLSISERIMAMFFQSVSTRTAGFNTIDIGGLTTSTIILYIILMYIGANPAGTAGGIKIPTIAVLYGYVKDWFLQPGLPVMLYGRRISKFALSHAIRLFFFSILTIGLITFFICAIESEFLITPDSLFNFTKVIFEVFSAFGTVGLSMGFPGSVTSFSAILSPASKFLIILTMLFGRLGPLTILASLPWKRAYADHPLSPDFDNVEKIQIG